MTRRWLPALLILLGGWGLLEALSYQAELGHYAKSPQRLQLSQGLTAIVGGGRAGLVFLEDRFRKKAQILVRCEAGRTAIDLRRGQVSDELCGVRVELIDILPEGKIEVIVRWGDDAEREPPSEAAPAAEAPVDADGSAGVASPDAVPSEVTDAEPAGAQPDAEPAEAPVAPAVDADPTP